MKKDIELKKSERIQVWKENNLSEKYEEVIKRQEVIFCGKLIGYVEKSGNTWDYYGIDQNPLHAHYAMKRSWAIQDLISDQTGVQINLI